METTKQHIETKSKTALKIWAIKTLHMSEQDWANFQYTQGETYITRTFKHDTDLIQYLRASKVFWDWWKHHWARRDARLREDLTELNSPLSTEDLRTVYLDTHSVWPPHPQSIILKHSILKTYANT